MSSIIAAAWLDSILEICAGPPPFGAPDYIALARAFPTITVSNIPLLSMVVSCISNLILHQRLFWIANLGMAGRNPRQSASAHHR